MNCKFQIKYILFLIIFLGCAHVQSTTSPSFKQSNISELAVIVIPGEKTPQRQIEDVFISAIMKKGYKIVSRSDFEQIMNEMKLQYSDITDVAAAEIGKILNIPAILIVQVTQIEEFKLFGNRHVQVSIGARLISVEKSEVLWIGTFSHGDLESGRRNLFLNISYYIADSFPSRY